MKIIVLVKEVSDTYGDRVLSMETGLADRAASEQVLDEIGERALEVALAHADAHPGTEVIVLSMAPESATANLRKALAIGASSAIHVIDDGLLGADLGLTAQVIAAAAAKTGFDLLIAGNQSTDGSGGVLPVMVAELLDMPSATYLTSVDVSESAVVGARTSDGATMSVSASLPAVISVTEALPDARFANFKGIMAAKKKEITTLSLADLGIDADDPDAARSIMIAVNKRPPRAAGVKIVDEGDAGDQLADFLVQNRLV